MKKEVELMSEEEMIRVGIPALIALDKILTGGKIVNFAILMTRPVPVIDRLTIEKDGKEYILYHHPELPGCVVISKEKAIKVLVQALRELLEREAVEGREEDE